MSSDGPISCPTPPAVGLQAGLNVLSMHLLWGRSRFTYFFGYIRIYSLSLSTYFCVETSRPKLFPTIFHPPSGRLFSVHEQKMGKKKRGKRQSATRLAASIGREREKAGWFLKAKVFKRAEHQTKNEGNSSSSWGNGHKNICRKKESQSRRWRALALLLLP